MLFQGLMNSRETKKDISAIVKAKEIFKSCMNTSKKNISCEQFLFFQQLKCNHTN